MSYLAKRLRIKAGMIEMGELIEWGSDSALMREAADALEMAAPAEWDGAGLPPVGIECEVLWMGNWVACEVLAHRKNFAAVYLPNEVTAGLARIGDCRPIRTPEQIAAEKREREINELVEAIVTHYEYPKGAESYIGLARALHNAGYRKTEQEENND